MISMQRGLLEVVAALQDACQCGHYYQSSLWRFFRTGGTQWTEISAIEYEDWGKTRLPAISPAGSDRPGLGDQDSLEDLDFADDLVLLSHRIQDMRDKTIRHGPWRYKVRR